MPILFSAIACNRNIKSKYASCDGNFIEIIEEVISKLPPGNSKMTYFHGHYLLHYILEDMNLYFCITDKGCQRSRAFLFLNEIQRQFKTREKEEFADVLAAQMYRYSEDYNTITIRKGEIDELNRIGVDSSETILGEKILFVENTENLTYFSTISYVRKTPENVEVSTNNYNDNIVDESINNSKDMELDTSTNNINDKTLSPSHPSVFPVASSAGMLQSSGSADINDKTYTINYRSYVRVIVTLVIILGLSFCTLEPTSCIIVTCIFVLYYVRSYAQNKT